VKPRVQDGDPRPMAPAVDAVNQSLQTELAAHPEDLTTRERLLGAADLLLHRAVLDDLTTARRAARAADFEALAKQLAQQARLAVTDADPLAVIEQVADAFCDGTLSRDVITETLVHLAATDLPELGRTSTPEMEATAAAAMDWLGGDAPATISFAALGEYLGRRAGTDAVPVVRSVRRISGGFSKVTTLVSVSVDGREEEIVLRQLSPGRDRSGLVAEYQVVRFAWENGVPAPEPLWVEPDDNSLGGAFFATRRVPGANVGDVFGPRSGATDPAPAHGLARALASLHALDHTGVAGTPVAPMASHPDLLARIGEQREQVARVAAVDGGILRPLHELLFAWLRIHAPTDVAHPVLLHGDPGFHNLLVDNGEVQALLDWERARIGEAEQDLAYVRPHVTPVIPWEDFVTTYCAAGGSAPRDDRLAYYAVWHDAWRFAGAYRGKARLLAEPRAVLDAVTGLLHAPRFLLSGLRNAFEVDL
jgi:aminoglycoside phosphotransferase (APT) family kinase protein